MAKNTQSWNVSVEMVTELNRNDISEISDAAESAIAAGGGGVFEGAFDFASYDDVPVLERDPEKQKIHFEREWYDLAGGLCVDSNSV